MYVYVYVKLYKRIKCLCNQSNILASVLNHDDEQVKSDIYSEEK